MWTVLILHFGFSPLINEKLNLKRLLGAVFEQLIVYASIRMEKSLVLVES